MLPVNFSQAAANEITTHLRHKTCEAVDAGVSRVVIDMSQLKAADMTLIKLGISVIQLCVELDIRYNLIGSEVVRAECKNYEETKDWQFIGSVEEAVAVLNGKTLSVA
jgi:two-component system cell cycle response regulator